MQLLYIVHMYFWHMYDKLSIYYGYACYVHCTIVRNGSSTTHIFMIHHFRESVDIILHNRLCVGDVCGNWVRILIDTYPFDCRVRLKSGFLRYHVLVLSSNLLCFCLLCFGLFWIFSLAVFFLLFVFF